MCCQSRDYVRELLLALRQTARDMLTRHQEQLRVAVLETDGELAQIESAVGYALERLEQEGG